MKIQFRKGKLKGRGEGEGGLCDMDRKGGIFFLAKIEKRRKKKRKNQHRLVYIYICICR